MAIAPGKIFKPNSFLYCHELHFLQNTWQRLLDTLYINYLFKTSRALQRYSAAAAGR